MDNKIKYKILSSIIDSNYERNNYCYARYRNDPSVELNTASESNYNWGINFDYIQNSDLGKSAQVNIIKSCVDTIVSKLANQKARPYFNPVNGSPKTRLVVKQAQTFFDALYEQENIVEKISKAFLESCIFGRGYVWVNPISYNIEVLPSWCVGLFSSEAAYGTPKTMLVKYNTYPSSLLDKKTDKIYVRYAILVDLETKKVEEYIDDTLYKSHTYTGEELPFVQITYNTDVYGAYTPSIVDELDGIQTRIDEINAKISAASQLTPANVTYVIEGSNLNPGDVSAETGMVYGVKLPVGMTSLPVQTVTPAPFDPVWQNLLEFYIKQAYEVIGVSQLSAMSKKPAGLDSGTALQTMEDIESDRFETQVTHYVNTFVKLAKVFIDVIPEDADIVIPTLQNSSFKWKDIKEQTNCYKIQYSAATALSKDPQEKMKFISQLSQMGLISPYEAGQYLDLPDLQGAFEGSEAVMNGVNTCIDNALNGNIDIPDYINYQQLAQRIAIVENQLYSSLTGDKKNDKDVVESLANIQQLEDKLLTVMQENGFVESTQPEEAVTTDAGMGIAPSVTGSADITSIVNNTDVGNTEGEAMSGVNPTEIGNAGDVNVQ